MPSQHTDQSDLCWRLSFGRTGSQVSVVEGRKHIRRGVRRAIADCDVLLQDKHEGYITWDVRSQSAPHRL